MTTTALGQPQRSYTDDLENFFPKGTPNDLFYNGWTEPNEEKIIARIVVMIEEEDPLHEGRWNRRLILNGWNLSFIIEDVFATAVARLPLLDSRFERELIDLSSNAFHTMGAMSLALLVSANTNLKILQIAHNSIGPIGARSLARALRENTTLRFLGLSDTGLTEESVARFGEALAVNSTLVGLDMRNNGLTEEAVKDLAVGLESNRSLKDLYLRRQRDQDFPSAQKVRHLIDSNLAIRNTSTTSRDEACPQQTVAQEFGYVAYEPKGHLGGLYIEVANPKSEREL